MVVSLLTTDSVLHSTGLTKINERITQPRSEFLLNVKEEGEFLLKFNMLGYQTMVERITVKFPKRGTVIEAGLFEIQEKNYHLNEATVTASKIRMVMKGDTIVYNADAFQLAQGSMLDALVSQLPGVELKNNGQIFVNGKFVQNLTLNGRDFFKGDPKMALENLPAYMIDKVKVYEKAGDLSHFMQKDMGDKLYTMDVKLKKQYSVGWIANAEAGIGTEDRYLGKAFGLGFTKYSRLTAFANLNNLNDNQRSGRQGDWRSRNASLNGLQTTQTGGLSYSFEKQGKITKSISSNNKVEHFRTDNETYTNSTTFFPDGDVYYRSFANSRNQRIEISSDNDILIMGSKHWYDMSVMFDYQKAQSDGHVQTGTFNFNPSDFNGNILDSLFLKEEDMGKMLRDMIVNRRRQEQKNNGSQFQTLVSPGYKLKINDNLLAFKAFYEKYSHSNEAFNRFRLDYFSGTSSSDYRRYNILTTRHPITDTEDK